jgi:hypothetical protein
VTTNQNTKRPYIKESYPGREDGGPTTRSKTTKNLEGVNSSKERLVTDPTVKTKN